MKRKILYRVLALCFCFILSGCNKKESNLNGDSTVEIETNEKKVESVKETKADYTILYDKIIEQDDKDIWYSVTVTINDDWYSKGTYSQANIAEEIINRYIGKARDLGCTNAYIDCYSNGNMIFMTTTSGDIKIYDSEDLRDSYIWEK